MGLLRILTKIHHYRLPLVGVCGFALTAARSEPGAHLRTVGPVGFDAFYLSLAVCGALMLSVFVLGEYDPEEYGIGPSAPEE